MERGRGQESLAFWLHHCVDPRSQKQTSRMGAAKSCEIYLGQQLSKPATAAEDGKVTPGEECTKKSKVSF